MANDSIPRRDAQFHARQNIFVTNVNRYLAELGLAGGDAVDRDNSAATWTADYSANTAGQTRVQAARQAKDNARERLNGAIRPATCGVIQPYA